MDQIAQQETGIPIAEVEQATGIARATLRIWERRYDFPRPGRDGRGERCYPGEQVLKLRQIAGLMAQGHRPGRLVRLEPAQLAAMDATEDRAPNVCGEARLADDPVIELLRNHDFPALQGMLELRIRTSGLAGFVCEEMPRMNGAVGDAWACGAIQVYEEHLYTEAVQQALRGHMAQLPSPGAGTPRVLLATFPEESHGLGLLMAQAMFMMEGTACASLGVRVPVAQIVTACSAFRADVLGLSFTPSANPTSVLRGLELLRAELPVGLAVWCGGSSPVIARRRPAGVHYVPHVRDLPALLARWRADRLRP